MNRNTLTTFTVALSLAFASGAFAQSGKPAAEQAKQQKLVRVATLPTAEVNREFQSNVQLMQAQRQAAVELNTAFEKETDAKKKAELKKQLDQALAKLNENNEKMTKAYGFSLNRNYTMEIVSSNIYMLVSDEEAAAIEKAAKDEAAKAAKGAKKK